MVENGRIAICHIRGKRYNQENKERKLLEGEVEWLSTLHKGKGDNQKNKERRLLEREIG